MQTDEQHVTEPEELDDEVADELDPIIAMLKKERLAKGWTQWDVARRMGFTSAVRISQLESGTVDPLLSTIRNWAKALDVEILGRALQKRRGRPRSDFR